MVYHMNIAGLERDLPLCKLNDKLCIGAFVIFGDQELTVASARELLKLAPEYDYLITAEAKGRAPVDLPLSGKRRCDFQQLHAL